MKKIVSTALTNSNIAKIIALLTETPVKLKNLSHALSSEQLCQPLGPAERSITQNLAHLLNCEARSSEAIILALLIDDPVFISIHPERQLGKLLRFNQFPFLDLLAYFTLRRTCLLRVLESLTKEQWSRTICEEGKKRKESVYWRTRSLALHEFEHLLEIENRLNIVNSDLASL